MSNPNSQLALMHERRPEWVDAEIENVFQEAVSLDLPWHVFNGTSAEANYPFIQKRQLGAFDLVQEAEDKEKRQLRILDIGAGAGGFVMHCLERGHEAIGITIEDFRKNPDFRRTMKKLPAKAYQVVDAHHLAREVEGDFDLIVGSYTFLHMIDPLSVIEQAVNKLRSTGVLAVNHFKDNRQVYQSGTNGRLVLDAMHDSGLDVSRSVQTGIADRVDIFTLIAQRGNDTAELRLPVEYRPEGTPLTDKPDLLLEYIREGYQRLRDSLGD